MLKYRPKIYLWLILIFFGLVYSLISFFNHYTFRTYALDLGLYTNAIYKYAHFLIADTAMFRQNTEYLLGDHFDLYLIIFSPLVYLFGSYTLLIIQIAFILGGGVGVYRYFRLMHPVNDWIPYLAAICFYSFFGVFSAVSYDYHSNVIAAMLIPWLFYFVRRRNFTASAIIVASVLIAKENMALWMLFICLGLILENRKDKQLMGYLSLFSLASIIYFLVVIYLLMPLFTRSGQYEGFTYSILGNTPWEALQHIFLHPIDTIKTLFINHTGQPHGNYIKLELHILVIVSGAYLLLLKPGYLIMLIPIYFQKMFHDNIQMWGINSQYAIEFAPILAVGIFSAITEFKSKNARNILATIILAGIVLSTIRVMDSTVVYTQKSRIRFYQARHYQRNYNIKATHDQLNKIPADAAVSAQSPFVPHLALREKIYQFPFIKDAEYVVLSMKEEKYPLDEVSFKESLIQLKTNGNWMINYSDDNLLILKKNTLPPPMIPTNRDFAPLRQ